MAGHIRRRGATSYELTFELEHDPVTGRRRQGRETFRGTRKAAEARLVELLHQRDNGVEPPPRRMKVAEYLERWQCDYVATLAPKTAQEYRRIIERRLVPAFGSLELTALRPVAIQGWYTSLLASGRKDGQGLVPKSVLRYHQVLHAALHHAVRWQLLIRNPADAVEPPRGRRRELLLLAPADVSRLLEAADAQGIGPLVRMAVLTGLRRGELLGLRWRDVDLAAATAHVQQVAQRIRGQGMTFREPKTHLSRRALALSPETVAMLRKVRASQLEARMLAGPAWHDLDLVFTTGLGTAIEPGNLTRSWARVQAAAGVGHVRWHDLRHAHATLLLQQGVHPKVVSERLGHASVAITLDTYSHVLPGLQASAAAALDALLAQPVAEADAG